MSLLSWNIGGPGSNNVKSHKAGEEIAKLNADLLFLQEANKWPKAFESIVAPGYSHLLPADEEVNKSVVLNYIAYKDSKLCHIPFDCDLPTPINSGKWKGRICMGAFKIVGKGKASHFVAICLHAPKKEKHSDKGESFETLRAFVDDVAQTMPVVIGGDFNAAVCWWEMAYGYSAMHYVPCGTRPDLIDFITMKCPAKNYSVTGIKATEVDAMFDHQPVQATLRYFVPIADEKAVGSHDENVQDLTSRMEKLRVWDLRMAFLIYAEIQQL